MTGMLKAIDSLSLLYGTNKELQQYLKGGDYSQEEYYKQTIEVDKLFENYFLLYLEVPKYATIYSLQNEKIFVNYNTSGNNYNVIGNKIKTFRWFKELINSDKRKLWTSIHQNLQPFPDKQNKYVLSQIRLIKDYFSLEDTGVVIVSIPEIYFSKIFENIKINGGEIFIVDKEGAIICHQNKDKLFSTITGKSYFDNLYINTSGTTNIEIADKKNIIVYDTIKMTGWKIVQRIPQQMLMKDIIKLRSTLILLALIIILLALYISYIVSNSITNPIRKLRNAMEDIKHENLDSKVIINSGDEIEELADSFNSMVSRIDSLINRIYIEQEKRKNILLEKKQAEIDLLQAQINPHFLFNTLNSIKWMAIINQDENVSEMIEALGSLLEVSINTDEEIIKIDKEIKNLKNYITLMQMRYNDKFRVEFNIESGVGKYLIPKLTLQPLVENSILHGFSDYQENCQINISIKLLANDKIQITISDNGKGISEEILEEILIKKKENGKKFSSIGLNNVNQKIKFYFGKEYGLNIERKRQGTRVKILIPTNIQYKEGKIHV